MSFALIMKKKILKEDTAVSHPGHSHEKPDKGKSTRSGGCTLKEGSLVGSCKEGETVYDEKQIPHTVIIKEGKFQTKPCKKDPFNPGPSMDHEPPECADAEWPEKSESESAGNRMYESNCGCTDLDGTPEKEENLYKERFSPRNERLFEQLLNKWTK